MPGSYKVELAFQKLSFDQVDGFWLFKCLTGGIWAWEIHLSHIQGSRNKLSMKFGRFSYINKD